VRKEVVYHKLPTACEVFYEYVSISIY